MPLRNSPQRWGSIARFLHWGVALGVIGLAIVGLLMDEMSNSPDKVRLYALHKSTGITLLALVVLRLLWRFVDARPPYPATMPRWQRAASDVSHGLLYAWLLVMPLSGWLYNSASNFPLRWYGLFTIPALSGPDRDLKHLAHDIHERGIYVLAVLFAIHVAAALKHHFIDKDATLARMTPGVRDPGQETP